VVGPGVGVTASDAVTVSVGWTVVGSTVVGATVVGATVVGATVVGATVVGATVVGATVVGATVVGATVVGATVVGVAVVVLPAAGVVLPAAGVVGVVPDGFTTGPTVLPVVVAVVVGLSRAFMSGESPVTVPDRLVVPPIAFGLPELPFAWAAAGESIGSAVGAGQLAALQAMNPLDELPDWDAPVPNQQMSVIAPSTPVPITRFRTECGRCKSSSFGCCRYNDFPPAFHSVLFAAKLAHRSNAIAEHGTEPSLRGHDSITPVVTIDGKNSLADRARRV
jgi:hypothetical protein